MYQLFNQKSEYFAGFHFKKKSMCQKIDKINKIQNPSTRIIKNLMIDYNELNSNS